MFDNKRLKQRRLDMGLTLEEVGNIVGIGKSAVQKYEKGTIKNIYVSVVEAFSKALRCSPAYLMGWSDIPNEKKEDNNNELTPHEKSVINAYRKNPSMQSAVDRLLGVEFDINAKVAQDIMDILNLPDLVQPKNMKPK